MNTPTDNSTAKPAVDKVIPDETLPGSDHHAGDGGYSIGTQEKYEEFVKKRNKKPE